MCKFCPKKWLHAFNHENPKIEYAQLRIEQHLKWFDMFNFIGAGCFDMVSSTALVYPYPKRCILRTLISTSSLLLLSLLCVSERGKKSFIIFKVELLNGFFSLSPFLHFLSYFCIWLRRSSCKQWVFKAEASIYNIYFSCFIMCQANLCTDENTFSDIIVRDFLWFFFRRFISVFFLHFCHGLLFAKLFIWK